jgi:hypothetical protein
MINRSRIGSQDELKKAKGALKRARKAGQRASNATNLFNNGL